MSHSRTTLRPIGRARQRRATLALTAGIGLVALGAPAGAGATHRSATTSPASAEEERPPDLPVPDGPAGEDLPEDPSGPDATPDLPIPDETGPPSDGPTPTPTPAPTAANVFASSFTDGLGEFSYQTNRHRIDVVDDPVLGSARKVLRFRVHQGDTGVTSNPRAQLETPYTFRAGEDRYFGYSVNLARDFPTQLPRLGWVTLADPAYGPPYAGASPFALRVQNRGGEAVVRWQRNAAYNFDIPWTGPRVADVRGRWLDFVIRVRLSGDPRVGFVEMWMNTGSGWRQQSLAGRSRLYMRTYDRSNGGGTNNSRVLLYYRRDIRGPLTMYHGPLRVASASSTAFAAVAPTSYR